jgi:hypothetical protein
MSHEITVVVDKSAWGEGPWQAEPNRVDFEHAGLPCFVKRNPRLGFWCGYAGVAPGHPCWGKQYDELEVEVHGGLTYSARCSGPIRNGKLTGIWPMSADRRNCLRSS